jgi:adenosylcobinamide-phosphate synthase
MIELAHIIQLAGVSVIILISAVLLDLIIGDPKWLPHPVIGMGNLISTLEKRWNQGEHRKLKGIVLMVSVVGITYVLAFIVVYVAYELHVVIGIMLEIYLISTTIAIKGLRDAAIQVAVPLSQGDLAQARKKLSMIVGRDTDTLPESEIVRGTVETVAENTVDGITAPLFFALIGGTPLALAYRAVNTLDSMVGYKNERYIDFGWASARLDDVLNWIPARITSLAIWSSAFFIPQSRIKQALTITFRDAPKHPSPNSGWSEAMVAGLMGVQLGGRNMYQGIPSNRAKMGEATRELQETDIGRSIIYMHGGWVVFLIIILFINWIVEH